MEAFHTKVTMQSVWSDEYEGFNKIVVGNMENIPDNSDDYGVIKTNMSTSKVD